VKKKDLEIAEHVLGQDYRKQTAIDKHKYSSISLDEVFDQQADQVTCPACSCRFSPMIATCPDCGLQFG
jgi:hypothetical protein